VRAGEATPKLQSTTEEAFYARAGFLGYVAGKAQERKLVPRVDLPPEVIEMPRLVDVIAGRAKGRTEDRQTSFFLNVGAIGAQFEWRRLSTARPASRAWDARFRQSGFFRIFEIEA